VAYTNDDRLQVASQAVDGVLLIGNFTATTSTTLRQPNPERTCLVVFNEGPGILYLLYGPGTVSDTNYTVALFPNAMLELPFYQGEVRGIFDTASSNAKITEL